MPSLLQDVQATAPGVRVELVPYTSTAVRELADGRYDGLIAPDAARSDDLRGTQLGTWPWAVYGREGHPAFAEWSLEAWSAYPHLRVRTSVLEGQGPTDRRAAQLGIRRTVGAVVPNFSMAAPVLAQTDLLLTVPSVTMYNTVDAYHLQRRDIPFDLAPMGLSLFRSAAEGDEPGVHRFTERVAATFHRLDESY